MILWCPVSFRYIKLEAKAEVDERKEGGGEEEVKRRRTEED